MSEKLSIDQLKLFVSALALTGTTVGSILDDGKVDLKDLPKLPEVLGDLRAFSAVDYAKVMPEIADLSNDEAQELSSLFEQKFDIKADSIEAVIEQGLQLVVGAFEAIQTLKELGAKIKAGAARLKGAVA